MRRSASTLRLIAAALVFSGGLIVASCGGGSVSKTPVVQGTNAPQTTQSIPAGGGSLTVPGAANGQVATLGFAAGATGGVTITSSSSTSAPGGAPVPSSLQRSAEAISGAVPFFYVTFSVSASLTASLVTGETVSLTSSDPATASYFVEFDDITASPATKLGCAGPGTVANLIASISNSTTSGTCVNSGGSTTLTAGHTYLAQFYYVAAAAPTSTPTGSSPTSTPSGSPTSTPTGNGASPTPIPGFTFTNHGADNNVSCTASACTTPVTVTDSPLTLSATFASPNPSTELSMNIALTTAEISPNNGTFPVYTPTGGAVELYFQLSATPATVFPLTPALQLSGLTGVTQCVFYGYVTSTTNSWQPISPATGSAHVTSGSASFPAVSPGGTINITPTPFYGAIVCT